ncbi:MAG: SRPBCC domain-containing protein [Vicinamibacterales bacterium]
MFPLLALIASLMSAQASPVSVEKLSTPEKALRFEVVVPASVDEVWDAIGTKAGMETWIWREARVDLKPGGEWTVVYTPTATGGGTIVSLVPKQQIVMRAMAPEQFPTVRKERTVATWGFESLGARSTKVTLVQTGWKTGPEWDAAYEYLSKGNAQLLTQLRQRFVTGPIDWSKLKQD